MRVYRPLAGRCQCRAGVHTQAVAPGFLVFYTGYTSDMTDNNIHRAIQAARNNALWCDAVCRANDAPGEFHPSIWLNRHAVPPFYSNAVTLTAGGAAQQVALIAELAAARRSFSVKDSFSALDLRPLGFHILFEATWLWRAADLPALGAPPGLSWSVVRDAAALGRWEAAWAGLHAGQLVADHERIFRRPLLAEPGVALLAGERDGAVIAVAAANLTGDADGQVAGLSNVFAPPDAVETAWAGAIAFAAGLFPGRPLAGYERGDDLTLARSMGFAPCSELCVWTRH